MTVTPAELERLELACPDIASEVKQEELERLSDEQMKAPKIPQPTPEESPF